ncbi:hypothetical protein BSKO_11235 [Bryopsis sp. KO-2023]|nr:hypothetical protein BSKO_11235 [Bryopsis sp. KO-2023]
MRVPGECGPFTQLSTPAWNCDAQMVNFSGATIGQLTRSTSLPVAHAPNPVPVGDRVLRRQARIRRRRHLSLFASYGDLDAGASEDASNRGNGEAANSENVDRDNLWRQRDKSGQERPGNEPETSSGSSESSSEAWAPTSREEEAIQPATVPVYYDVDEDDDESPSDLINPNPGMLSRADLRADLLASVAGLDRGFAASAARISRVREAAERIQTVGGIVELTGTRGNTSVGLLNGIWRLVYSSAFESGNLGGNRPGPFSFQLFATPFSLGQIYQRIDCETGYLDNIVELIGVRAPRLPWVPINASPTLRLSLMHDLSFVGTSGVSIKYREGALELLNSGFGAPKLEFPPLPDFLRQLTDSGLSTDATDGSFTVVYLDNGLRVTEGDRGELRIFVRDDGSSGL